MLYDHKRWDKEIKADPLTLESLIAWLEKRRASDSYNYSDCSGKCLYGMYMRSHGIKWKESGGCGPYLYEADPERIDFCRMVYDHIAGPQPWTFGAALERARATAGK